MRWIIIEEFDMYEINEMCQVRNRKTGRILKAAKNGEYWKVVLRANGKSHNRYITRLAAKAFDLPSVDGFYEEVNHKDCNPDNNHIDNLEWCSKKYNLYYADHFENIKAAQKKKAIWMCDKNTHKKIRLFESRKDAARQLKFSAGGIKRVLDGVSKHCKGYYFEYA